MAAAAQVGKIVRRGANGDGRRASDGKAGVRLAVASALLVTAASHAETYSLVISGLGGEPAYEQRFREQAEKIATAARNLTGSEATTTLLTGAAADRESVRRELRSLAAKAGPDDEVIVTLIGHGTFDGEQYRFNLPGPDLTAAELGTLFDELRSRRQLIVNATSASGAVVDSWKREQRIVVTATKSGGERTATRFAEHWVNALTKLEADTNKDDIITATEAFDYATRKVAESFKSDALLATEHSRLSGENAGRFQVARMGTAARVSSDPALNEMYAQRVRIERELDSVKERKTTMVVDAYYDELEGVLVRLAQLQRQIDAKQPAGRE
jgi:hypothetical protein